MQPHDHVRRVQPDERRQIERLGRRRANPVVGRHPQHVQPVQPAVRAHIHVARGARARVELIEKFDEDGAHPRRVERRREDLFVERDAGVGAIGVHQREGADEGRADYRRRARCGIAIDPTCLLAAARAAVNFYPAGRREGRLVEAFILDQRPRATCLRDDHLIGCEGSGRIGRRQRWASDVDGAGAQRRLRIGLYRIRDDAVARAREIARQRDPRHAAHDRPTACRRGGDREHPRPGHGGECRSRRREAERTNAGRELRGIVGRQIGGRRRDEMARRDDNRLRDAEKADLLIAPY